METDRSNRTRLRRYFGNVLLILTIGFTVLLTVQMLRWASRVVLRDDVILVLRYELVFCAGWILLALVIRLGGIRLPGRIGQLIGRILKGALMVYGVVSMVFLGSIIADGLTSDAVPCSTVRCPAARSRCWAWPWRTENRPGTLSCVSIQLPVMPAGSRGRR